MTFARSQIPFLILYEGEGIGASDWLRISRYSSAPLIEMLRMMSAPGSSSSIIQAKCSLVFSFESHGNEDYPPMFFLHKMRGKLRFNAV